MWNVELGGRGTMAWNIGIDWIDCKLQIAITLEFGIGTLEVRRRVVQ
jgi:hypothetical protein